MHLWFLENKLYHIFFIDLTNSITRPRFSLFCKPFAFKLHKFIISLADIFYGIEWHTCTFKGRIVCIKYRSRPVHDMLKNILRYIHGKVRKLFTGIEICGNDIKCCIFVILCRYCRLISFFFYLTKLELLYFFH
jgi:hypothetical protein